jgi:hypothetical protein
VNALAFTFRAFANFLRALDKGEKRKPVADPYFFFFSYFTKHTHHKLARERGVWGQSGALNNNYIASSSRVLSQYYTHSNRFNEFKNSMFQYEL